MAKNTHLEHVEDEILNKGSMGAKEVLLALEELGEFLSENTSSNLLVTTKFDGAPAIICGTDPSDGRFFVGTKSVFAKTEPKVMKTRADISNTYQGQLAEKLQAALTHLPSCNIRGVLQGDLMFTNDKMSKTINGKQHTAFKPNTITYAVETNSTLGRQINAAALGIVFHTKYTGPSLPEMAASFGVSDSDFSSSSSVWAQKAVFENVGGAANFSPEERRKFNAVVNEVRTHYASCAGFLNEIQTGKKALGIDAQLKIFFNRNVRTGSLPTADRATDMFYMHMRGEYQKAADKVKTPLAKDKKVEAFVGAMKHLEGRKAAVKSMFKMYLKIVEAKNMVVVKMNAIKSLGSFIEQSNGDYKATPPEGYVAIGTQGAIKLVDRLEFSRLNFTQPKNFGR